MFQHKIFELENRAELPNPVCELHHSGLSRLCLVLHTILYAVRVNIISGRYSNSSWEKRWAIHTGDRVQAAVGDEQGAFSQGGMSSAGVGNSSLNMDQNL